ncbi:hypothetical protein CARUB_v10002107mg [Capsella rubella]|uniref:RNase H type-1 domain-containing protein n=1 Tax=Capsella rubella TaxID=81985 RepID=R0HD70_9BRAS|nr:hypothetical protein CARUB_v10002107mg [Capsella rubella]
MEANIDNEEPEVSAVQGVTPSNNLLSLSECQCDASLSASDPLSGLGWSLDSPRSPPFLGMRCSRRGVSPLHAGLDSLLWAMECLISLDQTHFSFASKCVDIIKMIDNTQDWPTFAAELETFKGLRSAFPAFSIRHLPRRHNIRADFLENKARARGCLFSHASTSFPIGSPA